MATELEGKPLKFTAIFEKKEAEMSMDAFLKKIQDINSKGVGNNANKAVNKASGQYTSILEGVNQTFGDFVRSNERFYSAIAQSEMGLQKIRNEQGLLNKELKQGLVSEQDYINKTAQLTQMREKLSQQLKDNKTQLQQYNSVSVSKPAFTRQDTLSELGSAHAPKNYSTVNSSAIEAFTKSTQDAVGKLKVELSNLDNELNKGSISNENYAKSVDNVNSKLKVLSDNQEYFNNNSGKDLSLGSTLQKNVQEQIGLLEKAKIKLNELKAEAAKASDASSLSKINREIESYSSEIKRLSSLGTQAFELQSKSMASQEGILQRLQRAASLYQRGIVEATRVENIDKYTQKLSAVNAEMSRLTRGANIGMGWNGLQNSINQLTRELPAFTYSVQTGFMAISNNIPIFIDEINRLRVANEQLVASGQKGTPVWKQLVSGLFSWQTLMSVGITLMTVYGKEIANWISELFKGKEALDSVKASQDSLNKAFSDNSFSKAVQDILSLKNAVALAKKGFVDKKSVVEEYNKTIGKTTGEVKNLYEVEQFLIKNADNYVKMMLYKAAANKSLEEAAKSALEAEKARIKDLKDFEKTIDRQSNKGQFSTGGGAYVSQTDIKNANDFAINQAKKRKDEEVKIHTDAEDQQLNISKTFMKKAQGFADKMNISVFGNDPEKSKGPKTSNTEKLYDQIIKSRTDTYDKLLAIDKEYALMSLTQDEKELQVLRDKFADIRKVLEEENKKIADYNNKNKGKKGFKAVDLIDVGEVTPIEIKTTASVKERQDLDKKIEEYKIDYDNFLKYQELKKTVNEQYADEQYKDNLDAVKNYYTNLNAEIENYEKKQADRTITNNEKVFLESRKKERELANQKQKEDEQKYYIEAIQASQSYVDQLIEIEKKYQQYMSYLGANATEQQKAVLKKGLEDEKSTILQAQYERIANTEKMFYRLSFLGKQASLDAIANARKVLNELRGKGMSDKDFEQKSIELDTAEANVNLDKSWVSSTGALKKYREQLALYGKDSDQVKIAQKDMFSALASDLQNASSIIGDVGGLLGSLGASDETQKTVNQVGELVGGMGELAMGIASGNPIAIISGGIKTITSAIDLFSTKDKKIQKQIDSYKSQLDSLGKSYDALQKKMSGNDTNYYANSDQLISNLKEQQRLLEQSAKAEEEKKKTDKEKVKGYREQSEAITKQIEDTENAIRQMRLQTDINSLAQSITDALVGAFESGEDGIEAMDKAFDKFIKNSLANSARLKFVQKIIDDMLKEVDKYMASNDNSIVGFDFSKYEDQLKKAGKDVTDFLESAYDGLGLSKDVDQKEDSTISGKIGEAITEKTGSLLTGKINLQTETLNRIYSESQAHGLTLSKQLDIANKKLTVLNQINTNTAETVVELKNAVIELKGINKNTSSKGRTTEGMGL